MKTVGNNHKIELSIFSKNQVYTALFQKKCGYLHKAKVIEIFNIT